MTIQQTNYGNVIQLDFEEDISLATTKLFIFKSPSGSIFTGTATFVTSGTDGLLQYTFQSGQLDVDGYWRVQPYIILGNFRGFGEIINFQVYRNLTLTP